MVKGFKARKKKSKILKWGDGILDMRLMNLIEVGNKQGGDKAH
jgi:hypothetical protein